MTTTIVASFPILPQGFSWQQCQPEPPTDASATEALWSSGPDGCHLYLVLRLQMNLPVVLVELF